MIDIYRIFMIFFTILQDLSSFFQWKPWYWTEMHEKTILIVKIFIENVSL